MLFCNERPEGFVFDKALPDIWFYSALLACSELPLGVSWRGFAGYLGGLGDYTLRRSFGLWDLRRSSPLANKSFSELCTKGNISSLEEMFFLPFHFHLMCAENRCISLSARSKQN